MTEEDKQLEKQGKILLVAVLLLAVMMYVTLSRWGKEQGFDEYYTYREVEKTNESAE